MGHMFTSASAFDQDISAWSVDNVREMYWMFGSASSFNQNIGGWSVAQVTNMNNMFSGASAFNQDIGGWSVENVRDMHYMFHYASAFDQDLGWCVDNDVNLDEAFSYTPCASTSCGIVRGRFVTKVSARQSEPGWRTAPPPRRRTATSRRGRLAG
jgi:surface protein